MTEQELLLEQWKMASELHRHEDNLTWHRFRYFAAFNGVLFGFVATIGRGSLSGSTAEGLRNSTAVGVIVAIAGIVISFAWLLIHSRAQGYHRYRIAQARKAEQDLNRLQGNDLLTLYQHGLEKQMLVKAPLIATLFPIHNVISWLAALAAAAWFIFLIYLIKISLG